MGLRVGVDLISVQRVSRLTERFPARLHRILRDEERGKDFDDAALFAAKEAVVKAVGGLSVFHAASFSITRVRGGHAAIPRSQLFEARLVASGISWVAVNCGRAHDMSWALAVAMPGDLPAYDAVVTVRNLRQALSIRDPLDLRTHDEVRRKPQPEVSLAARLAAVSAAETLFDAPLGTVGIATRDDDSLCFTAPTMLLDVQVSVSHDGHYVAGAVARDALERRLRVDKGQHMGPSSSA
ncbi:MAG: 4'-phosphopantetheinyl transferase superfamily protein [Pseudomonadota bacterium]